MRQKNCHCSINIKWLHCVQIPIYEQFTLKYEWIAAVASLRILNRELKTLVLHLRWGNWRIYSTLCLSLILKGKSWNQRTKKEKKINKVRLKTGNTHLNIGAKCKYFSIPQGYILRQRRFCLLPVQPIAFGGDFASGIQWLQQRNQMWATLLESKQQKKKVVSYDGTPFTPESTWRRLMYRNEHRNTYGSLRSELAIICNDCKELPSFTWRKRFFFWGRTERTHPYNKMYKCTHATRNHYYCIALKLECLPLDSLQPLTHLMSTDMTRNKANNHRCVILTRTFILSPSLEPEIASDTLNLVGGCLQ